MDPQLLINIGLAAILAAGGWFARQLWEAVQKLKDDVHKIEVDLPTNYVRRDEFAEGVKEIKDICDKIFTKIDTLNERKADK